MSFLQRLVVNTLAFISLSVLFPTKIYVASFTIAIAASLVLSLLNIFVKPILHLLSLPITLITLGLFSFIINGGILKMTSYLVGEQNLAFSSFGAAVLMAMIMSLINAIVADHNDSKYR